MYDLSEEHWEWVDGYDNGTFEDDMVFEVDPGTKRIAQITGQALVSGENLSQFIRFQMPRFFDNIDLATKHIQIIYLGADNGTDEPYSDINQAVSVEKSEHYIRFGWLVPSPAVYYAGVVTFSIEFVGVDYVLKSVATELPVIEGLNGGEVIPEPVDKVWYIELQERCDAVLDVAEASVADAAQSATNAATSASDALSAKNSAQGYSSAASDSASAASASATAAANSADLAASVFTVAGDVSFAVASDGAVSMIFTESEPEP